MCCERCWKKSAQLIARGDNSAQLRLLGRSTLLMMYRYWELTIAPSTINATEVGSRISEEIRVETIALTSEIGAADGHG